MTPGNSRNRHPQTSIGSSDDLAPRLVRHQPRRNRLVGYPQQLVSVGLVDRFTEKMWLTKNVSTSKPRIKTGSPKWVEEVMRFAYLTTVSGWITPDFLSYLSSMVNEVVVIWSWLGIQNLRASLRGEKIMMEWHSHNSHILVVVSAYVLTMVLMFFFWWKLSNAKRERVDSLKRCLEVTRNRGVWKWPWYLPSNYHSPSKSMVGRVPFSWWPNFFKGDLLVLGMVD